MLQTGRALRKLGKKDLYRLLRWGPMAIADLVAEYFETDLLRGTIAARGIFGTFLGPWSAGSALVLLIRGAGDAHPAGSANFAAGGIGAITQAMASAAKAAGAEIRTSAEVAEIRVKDGVGDLGRAEIGRRDYRERHHLQRRPKAHVAGAGRSRRISTPGIRRETTALPHDGNGREDQSRPRRPPQLHAAIKNGNSAALQGRIQISPGIDYLERAFDESKYGDFSKRPYLEVTIPSLTDPSLAPSGKHVMSIYMQYAPYKLKGDWNAQRGALGDAVVKTLAEYAPSLPGMVLEGQIITPKDLEETYGLTGGHIFHGELALDQFFTMRPLLDWARYRTPIANLYLCGSGAHPGAGLTGGSGANAAREILKDLKK